MTPHDSNLTSVDEFVRTTFDYVVIGGGTAGLVLASRLSENPGITVGVLEAGKLRLDDENVNSLAGGRNMLHNPDYDWTFKTIPQVRSTTLTVYRAPVDMRHGRDTTRTRYTTSHGARWSEALAASILWHT